MVPSIASNVKTHRTHDPLGRHSEAVRIYDRLQRDGVRPGVSVILSALKACSVSRDLQTGIRIHSDLMASPGPPNIYVYNTLLDMYSKCGRLEDVKRVFDAMQYRNVVSWNTIIKGYAQSGEGEVALDLFSRMQREGVVANSRTYVAALKACTSMLVVSRDECRSLEQKHRCLKLGSEIHREAERAGHDSDTYVGSCLVDLYAKCGRMVEAREAFNRLESHDVVSWTALISGYVQKGDGKMGLALFEEMQRHGFKPNAMTFGAAVNAIGKLALEDSEGERVLYLEKGGALHCQLAKLGYEADIFVASSLVDMYSNCGCITEARKVFDRMKSRDVVAWNAIILGTAQCEDGELALKLFHKMQTEGFVANSRTYVAALNACSSLATKEEGKHVNGRLIKASSLEIGMELHADVRRRGYEPVIFVANSLVDMYAKCGKMDESRRVFEGIRNRNLFSWTVIIMGYAQNEDGEEAVKLYFAMKRDRDEEGNPFQPNAQTFMAILKACASVAALETGRAVHDEIYTSKLEKHPMVACSLIGFYGRCGNTSAAQEVFDSVVRKDAAVWSALIASYGVVGDAGRVLELFESMMRDVKLQPDGVTFLSVLTACSHAGLVEKGKEYLRLMSSPPYGLTPGIEHFTCMVDLLSRANHLEEAVWTAENMPVEASYMVWMSILSGCRKWKNVTVGQTAFEKLLQLDARDSAAYIAMRNLYSSLGMTNESLGVERLLKDLRLRSAGKSWWTDHAGNVHTFVTGEQERSHFRIILNI